MKLHRRTYIYSTRRMGFFNILKRGGNKGVPKEAATDGTESSTSSTTHKTLTSKSKKVKKPEKIEKSLAIKVAERYIGLYRSKEGNEDELFELFNPGSLYTFEDLPPIPTSLSVVILKDLNASFPDIKWEYEKMTEPRPGLVEISGFRVSGTHTGAPYTFRPDLPAIPAAGKFCQNDEENLTLHINAEGKIEEIQIVALGIFTGPPGFYEQIGGKMHH